MGVNHEVMIEKKAMSRKAKLEAEKHVTASILRKQSYRQGFISGAAWAESEIRPILSEAVELLRDLADLQNGPALEKYREEHEETMDQIYRFLGKYEPML